MVWTAGAADYIKITGINKKQNTTERLVFKKKKLGGQHIQAVQQMNICPLIGRLWVWFMKTSAIHSLESKKRKFRHAFWAGGMSVMLSHPPIREPVASRASLWAYIWERHLVVPCSVILQLPKGQWHTGVATTKMLQLSSWRYSLDLLLQSRRLG